MRYLRKIHEFEESMAPSVEPTETDYSGLSREEILALIDQAQNENDFTKVKRLLKHLTEPALTEFSHLLDYSKYLSLNENIQNAKTFLQGLADEAYKKKRTQITREAQPETPKEEIDAKLQVAKEKIQDFYFGAKSDFEALKKLLHKNPGYVSAFIKFRFLQQVRMEDLVAMYETLSNMRDAIKELPKSLDTYADSVQGEEHTISGFEELGDELAELRKYTKGKWIVDALSGKAMSRDIPQYRELGFGPGNPLNQRDLYRSTSKEKQRELLSAAAELNDLNEPTLIKSVRQNIAGRKSIDDIIDLIKAEINSAGNVDRLALKKKAMDSYPAAVVMYDGPNHMVISFRTDSELPFLADRANTWCIQPKWYNSSMGGRFWSYASPNTGTLQLVLYDFTKEASDPYYLVGLTIGPNGTVNSICTRPNRCSSGGDFRTYLKRVNTSDGDNSYPQDVIDGIDMVFQDESNTKKKLDDIYKKIGDYSKDIGDRDKAIAQTLIGLVRDMSTLTKKESLSSEDTNVNSKENIINQVLASELKRLRNSSAIAQVQGDYIHKYTQGMQPLPSAADVKIFEIILEESPRLTQSIINTIIANNQRAITVLDAGMKKIGSVDTALSRKIKLLYKALGEATIALEALKEKIKK
jgi:hypothetical protein